MIFILVLASASVGWLAGWIVFDYAFYQPQRKLLKDSLDGWGQTIDLLRDVKDQRDALQKEPKK